MPLSTLLTHASEDPAAAKLARDGGHAFVAPSMRAYLLAALADADPSRPAIVVAGDDRSARDLAADLKAWLAPRPVRFYPSRGVASESHLAPPPHLVGLRVAALDALLAADAAPVVVASAVALSEKVPDPELRPRGLTLRRGDLVDLDELAGDLVAAGYERVEQVEDRGQFAMRGGLVDLYPATEERAVRVDLFGDEIESLRWFSTFTQRSLGEAQRVEVAPAAELAPEHRALASLPSAEIAALEDRAERPDIAELLPVERFVALLDLLHPAAPALVIAADEEIEPSLGDHWDDVCAAFHDAEAHHLYVPPAEVGAALAERAEIRLSSLAGGQAVEFRAQAAATSARSLREAEPELERLVRSGYSTVVAWPRRGDGERAAYNLARASASWLGEGPPLAPAPGAPPDGDGSSGAPAPEGAPPEGALRFARAALREGFVAPSLHLAVIPEHRPFPP